VPVAKFSWHQAAVTSIEWSPLESSTLAVSGADHQLTMWDMALEDDPEADRAVRGRSDLRDIPPQLYFVHQGQQDVKELHWHAQVPRAWPRAAPGPTTGPAPDSARSAGQVAT